jgi:hypothetical protein
MRNSDGRFRNHNKPTVLSADTLHAQWVETEAIRLKRNGFSYEAIAEQITQVGRGQKAPVTPIPEGLRFPPDYKITAMGCHKAVQRGLHRAPMLEADEMRRLDTDRCEEMYLFLTLGIRQGDPQSVRAAVSALAHKAAINGYKSSEIQVRVSPGPSWASVGRGRSRRSGRSIYRGYRYEVGGGRGGFLKIAEIPSWLRRFPHLDLRSLFA